MIDSEDASESNLKEKSVNENVNKEFKGINKYIYIIYLNFNTLIKYQFSLLIPTPVLVFCRQSKCLQ